MKDLHNLSLPIDCVSLWHPPEKRNLHIQQDFKVTCFVKHVMTNVFGDRDMIYLMNPNDLDICTQIAYVSKILLYNKRIAAAW